ncbi:hypothetical protein [Methanoculleus chikugoensis]|uniref:hypothetical protein n=1 Tax=Methanoculleus chikugoensis TaxID=118126 RepID=UPI0006CF4E58|nr:hypothetical protein [Methanoculleus chikugoensis]
MHRLTGMAEDRAVLLAEPDRPPAAAKVSCWLQGEGGYTVVGVVERGGDEALAAAAASRPGFVVLDASLPLSGKPSRDGSCDPRPAEDPPSLHDANPVNTLPLGGPEGLSREEILEKPFGRTTLPPRWRPLPHATVPGACAGHGTRRSGALPIPSRLSS